MKNTKIKKWINNFLSCSVYALSVVEKAFFLFFFGMQAFLSHKKTSKSKQIKILQTPANSSQITCKTQMFVSHFKLYKKSKETFEVLRKYN